MWLVFVDANSKWPEVFCVSSTTTQVVSQTLEETFARHGIPEQLVSDNVRQFTSDEFHEFMKVFNIKHVTSSPYHARSNGEAERFIRTFKEKMLASELPLQRRLLQFLFHYRSTPHSTTGVSPWELLNGRLLRTRLSLVHPNVSTAVRNAQATQKNTYDKNTKMRHFKSGQHVIVQTFSKNDQKWTAGIIVHPIVPVTYAVDVDGRLMKRHVDQIRDHTSRQPSPSARGSFQRRPWLLTNGAVWKEPSNNFNQQNGEEEIVVHLLNCKFVNPHIHATSDIFLDRHQRKPQGCHQHASGQHTLNQTQSAFLE